MSVSRTITAAIFGLVLVCSQSAGAATFLGPSPYLCFDSGLIAGCGTAASPFAGTDFSAGYFHLEDFEDGALNTPGVASNPGGSIAPAGGSLTDSVDEDDGLIDGSGINGQSYFGVGGIGFTFSFDANVLGALPTHAGVVWTDGAVTNEVTFEAFDANGVSLGLIVGPNIGDNNFNNGTAEDRFFGVVEAGGISAIRIFNSMMSGGGSGIEVDHLQYGVAAPVPVPPAAVLLLGALGVLRRRRPASG